MLNVLYHKATLDFIATQPISTTTIAEQVSIRYKELVIQIKLESLAKQLYYKWSECLDRVNLAKYLMNQPILNDLEEAVGFVALYNTVENLISNAKSVDGILNYQVSGRLYKTELTDNHTDLVSSKLVLEGYSILEIPGSHQVVMTPRRLQHDTNCGHCSCNEYQELKRCDHVYFVESAKDNRKAFLTYNVIKIRR